MMASLELVPTAAPVEAPPLRRELICERRANLIISLHWLQITNEIQLELYDVGADTWERGIVPNDKVLEARDHPYTFLSTASE